MSTIDEYNPNSKEARMERWAAEGAWLAFPPITSERAKALAEEYHRGIRHVPAFESRPKPQASELGPTIFIHIQKSGRK